MTSFVNQHSRILVVSLSTYHLSSEVRYWILKGYARHLWWSLIHLRFTTSLNDYNNDTTTRIFMMPQYQYTNLYTILPTLKIETVLISIFQFRNPSVQRREWSLERKWFSTPNEPISLSFLRLGPSRRTPGANLINLSQMQFTSVATPFRL